MFDRIDILRLVLTSLLFFASGGAGALLFRRRIDLCRVVANGLALCGSIVVMVLGLSGLAGVSFTTVVSEILPLGGGLALGIDRLSGFFLLIIAAGAIPSALYAIGYTRHYRKSQSSMAFALNVFIPAMMLVVLSRNALT